MTTAHNTASVHVGKVYYFGWRETPNTVIEAGKPLPNGDVPVKLRGPRGGEFHATVNAVTGKCLKRR